MLHFIFLHEIRMWRKCYGVSEIFLRSRRIPIGGYLYTLILLVFAVLFSQHSWHMVLVKVVSSLPRDELVTRCWYIDFSILKYQNDYAHNSGVTVVNTNRTCTRLGWIQINCVTFNTLKIYSRWKKYLYFKKMCPFNNRIKT